MLVPHLIEVQSFSLLVNEAFGFSVGAAGILKIIIEKRGMIDSPFETKN
jgi:hypothetical protein